VPGRFVPILIKFMRIINRTRSAFTLLEVLLASMIFIVSVAGVFSTISAVRQPVHAKERALTAAVFGQLALETLRAQVNASNIDSTTGQYKTASLLAPGAHPAGTEATSYASLFSPQDQNGTTYTITYNVCCAVCTANAATVACPQTSVSSNCPTSNAGPCPADSAVVVTLSSTFTDPT